MAHIESIRYEFLFQFNSKADWIIHAQYWFKPYRSKDQKVICLDKAGNVLTTGKDFADAEIANTYPVKVYRLIRVSEVIDKLIKDLF